MNIFQWKKRNTGFTLIETIVSIVILSSAIVGPMMLSAHSMKASRDAKLELEATHLAEEGIEIVHNVRDNNSAHDTSALHENWMGSPNQIFTHCNLGCVPDVTKNSVSGVWASDVLVPCPSGVCTSKERVYYNPDTGLYDQGAVTLTSPWTPSPFTRSIMVEAVGGGGNPQSQVRVHVTVSYISYNGAMRTITMTEDLYNWFPCLPTTCP
jgi:prepilin-type N-terminal cleavage/methylation domain-containing protein